MRVLMLADVPANPDSGAAGTEYQTIAALRRGGHDVDAVWADALPHRIKHWNLHYLFELPFAYRREMLSRMKSKDYDVVHVNQPHGYLAAKALHQLKSRAVFIHRSHGFELRVDADLKPWREEYDRDTRGSLRKSISSVVSGGLAHNARKIARFADGHIVSASQCRDFLREQMHVPPERIAVIPQAPANSFLGKTDLPMTSQRLRRVLYVGQFVFFKAPMILAEVINRLSSADEEMEFTWVCSKEHHKRVTEMLSAIARSRLRLLDWVQQDELIEVYDSHGIFLFPSFFEGFGKVFLEAMSRGLCVVAANNSGALDVITDGEDGLLTPTGDVDAMTSGCLRLAGNLDDANRISHAAAETALSYTWDRVAGETVAFYQNRLDARARELAL